MGRPIKGKPFSVPGRWDRLIVSRLIANLTHLFSHRRVSWGRRASLVRPVIAEYDRRTAQGRNRPARSTANDHCQQSAAGRNCHRQRQTGRWRWRPFTFLPATRNLWAESTDWLSMIGRRDWPGRPYGTAGHWPVVGPARTVRVRTKSWVALLREQFVGSPLTLSTPPSSGRAVAVSDQEAVDVIGRIGENMRR